MWKRSPPDYYAVLHVPPEASAEEVRGAFLGLAKQFHPDLARDARQRKLSTLKMQELNAAYAVLGNAKKRAEYDAARSGPPPLEPAPTVPPRGPRPPGAPPAWSPPEPELDPATYGILLKLFLFFPAIIVLMGLIGFSGQDLLVVTALWFGGFHYFQQFQDPRPKR